jgi:protein phosphatase
MKHHFRNPAGGSSSLLENLGMTRELLQQALPIFVGIFFVTVVMGRVVLAGLRARRRRKAALRLAAPVVVATGSAATPQKAMPNTPNTGVDLSRVPNLNYSDDDEEDEDEAYLTQMSEIDDEVRATIESTVSEVADAMGAYASINPDDESQSISVDISVSEELGDDAPNGRVSLRAAAITDRGIKRKRNEDAFLVMDGVPLFLVADGMGGHAAGEVASRLAVTVIEEAFRTGDFDGKPRHQVPLPGDELIRSLRKANRIVHLKANSAAQFVGMGTTATAVRFSDDKSLAYIANVGDSRCYRIRNNELQLLTTDHNLSTLLGIQGSRGKLLTQAIGVFPDVAVDLIIDRPQPDDRYLVCSDGLTKMVDEDTILHMALHNENPEDSAKQFVTEANARGGRDNITVIVVHVVGDQSPKKVGNQTPNDRSSKEVNNGAQPN